MSSDASGHPIAEGVAPRCDDDAPLAVVSEVLASSGALVRCSTVPSATFAEQPATQVAGRRLIVLLPTADEIGNVMLGQPTVVESLRATVADGAIVVVCLASRRRDYSGTYEDPSSPRSTMQALLGRLVEVRVDSINEHEHHDHPCLRVERNFLAWTDDEKALACYDVRGPVDLDAFPSGHEPADLWTDRPWERAPDDVWSSITVVPDHPRRPPDDLPRPERLYPRPGEEAHLLLRPFWGIGAGEIHVMLMLKSTPQDAIDRARRILLLRRGPGFAPPSGPWDFPDPATTDGRYVVRITGLPEIKLLKQGWHVLKRLYDNRNRDVETGELWLLAMEHAKPNRAPETEKREHTMALKRVMEAFEDAGVPREVMGRVIGYHKRRRVYRFHAETLLAYFAR